MKKTSLGVVAIFGAVLILGVGVNPAAAVEPTAVESQWIGEAFAKAAQAGSEAVLDEELKLVAERMSAAKMADSPAQALDRVISIVDGEHWTEFENHHFGILNSFLRSQGLAINERGNYWYSSQASLLRTNSKWGFIDFIALFPIPLNLAHLGDNHIGDIDYADGKIYAGMEDGPKYRNPYVGIFDATTLRIEKYFRLPADEQIDGVPWVAVDPASKRIFTSVYTSPKKLNPYDMETLTPLPQIELSRVVTNIQGGKVLNGMMYLTSDGSAPDPKVIYKVNLSTGTVIEVARFGSDMHELEGLAFNRAGREIELDALGIGKVSAFLHLRSELRGFHRDQESMRDEFRRRIGAPGY